MENYNSNFNQNKDILEKILAGRGKPVSIDKINDLCKKTENSMCKILLCGNDKGTGFFFQQNIPNIKYYNQYFFMTNNHVINAESINNNFHIVIKYKKKERYII